MSARTRAGRQRGLPAASRWPSASPRGAATIDGTSRSYRLTGTGRDDHVHGRAGGGLVRGRSGEDHAYGGRGDDDSRVDTVFFGDGDDYVERAPVNPLDD